MGARNAAIQDMMTEGNAARTFQNERRESTYPHPPKTKHSHEFCSDNDGKATILKLSNSSIRITKSERSGRETSEIIKELSESVSNHENGHISMIAVRNLTEEVSPERAMQGEWTARKARGTVPECARYDERTSRVGRRARLAQQRLG
ncbi:hypothetical protein M404DRAFT_997600 [Pisolithus tinctorius Marx 270]|uniref:Uncharacterized protein n=1 Tax=Pisolithus tinctorius Marx 270 TaxID=870435 RepID=A0A0C3KE87_PISTI|nr:hypothetical protein M404DRAFT_997600 [Pisolithus tinctorius Marx 270]